MHTDGFLRNACILAAIAFLSITIAGVRGGIAVGPAVLMGLGGGLFCGLFGALWAAVLYKPLSRVAEPLMRLVDPGNAPPPVDAREHVTLPVPPEQALELCRAAVKGMTGTQGVRVAGSSVLARAGMAWVGTGQRIECRVEAAEGGSRVEIRSRPTSRFVLIDHGKNQGRVTRIRTALEELARQRALPGPRTDPRKLENAGARRAVR